MLVEYDIVIRNFQYMLATCWTLLFNMIIIHYMYSFSNKKTTTEQNTGGDK